MGIFFSGSDQSSYDMVKEMRLYTGPDVIIFGYVLFFSQGHLPAQILGTQWDGRGNRK